jgi:2-polyprenyl-6-methoxyphenol hydroxylase-like FAD-dependent oxidoreductase
MARMGQHAIVIGGSLAGLAAAASLAERYDRVTVVERDRLPTDAGHHTGVPQGRHGHILLPAGLRGLTDLLPGIVDDLQARGAHIVGMPDVRFHIAGGSLCPDDARLEIVGATRPLLEAVMRARVRALPGVGFLEDHEARGLVTTPDRTRVAGVRVRARGTRAVRTLDGNLVVDASGRGSPSSRWLADLGYAAPPEERLAVGVHYVTRLFRRRPADLDGCRHVVSSVPPDGRRGGFAVSVEDDRCLITLIGVLGERPPTDLPGFVDYARTLETRDLHELADGATPTDEASTGAFPAYLRRRYDRLRRFPGRYVVLGDAVCSLNPLYAQGMTMAIREAAVLGQVLDRHGHDGVGRTFFRRTRSLIDSAWKLATSADLGHPEVDGRRTLGWRLLNSYISRLFRAAHRDAAVANAYLRVVSMTAQPPTLVHPRIVWRVLTGDTTGGDGESGTPPARPQASGAGRSVGRLSVSPSSTYRDQ